jgi:ElaB/YqjD/DUF883 family membrane-anchored ribosome-binding protein
MGAKPDEIERQIAAQRANIDQRLQGLETRVKQDVDSVRNEASNRASGTVSGFKQVFETDGPMREHPLSMMAGALGLGVVLGMVSEGITSSGGGDSRSNGSTHQRDEGRSNGGGSSGVGSLLAGLVGPAATTAQNELQDLIKEGFASLKGKGDNGHTLRENRDVGVE